MTADSITPAELAEWKRLTEAATPEPWRIGDEKLSILEEQRFVMADFEKERSKVILSGNQNFYEQACKDAAFAAAARAAMPRLIAEVERLLKKNAVLRDNLDRWCFNCENPRKEEMNFCRDHTKKDRDGVCSGWKNEETEP